MREDRRKRQVQLEFDVNKPNFRQYEGTFMNEMLIQQYGIFLIGAGLSLVLFLLLFLILRRQSLKKRALRPAAQIAHDDEVMPAQSDDRQLLPQAPAGSDVPDVPEQPSGFKLFKRNSPKHAAPEPAQNVTRLQDIEQEMLAIRELFRQGQISRSVYVAETKALYETARLVQQA